MRSRRYEHHMLSKNNDAYGINNITLSKQCTTLGAAIKHLSATKEKMSRTLGEAIKNRFVDLPGVVL